MICPILPFLLSAKFVFYYLVPEQFICLFPHVASIRALNLHFS